MHQFFYYLLFDFDVRLIVNAVPINKEGLHKIHSNGPSFSLKGVDELKIIYYSRNRMKSSWLHLSPADTQGLFMEVALSLQTLNQGGESCLRDCFLPERLCCQMQSFIDSKLREYGGRGQKHLDLEDYGEAFHLQLSSLKNDFN